MQNSLEFEQRSPAWFSARKGLITASSVGAILGNSPHATKTDVMRRMVREWHGEENEFTGNIATEWGVNHESGALIEYVMETAAIVNPASFITRSDWTGCSPDGLLVDGGLEIKCPFGLRKEPNPQFKPLREQRHYYDQVQFSIWVTGLKFWHFYQWTPFGTKLEGISPDLTWQADEIPRLQQFYQDYLIERETNAEIHLSSKRKIIDSPEAHRIMAEYDQITEAIDNAEARKKELVAEMVRMAGDKNAVFAGRNLTKTDKAGAISYAKAIKELLPKANLEKWRGVPHSYWGVK